MKSHASTASTLIHTKTRAAKSFLKGLIEACNFNRHETHNYRMATRSKPHPDTLAAYRALGYNAPPQAKMSIRGKSQTLEQVVDSAPSLAHLSAMAQDTQNRLKAIAPLLPVSLRAVIQSGGVEDDAWCLLVPNSAVGAKLRQTLPALCAHLRSKGWNVNTIRIKVKAHS
jgi:hypothetical protein